MIQFLTFFAKAKQTAPRPRWTLSNMRVVEWPRWWFVVAFAVRAIMFVGIFAL